MDIVRDAAKNKDTIHFEVGQPDIPPSNKVKKALKSAVDKNLFSYTESFGIYELRQKISDEYKKNYGVDVNPSRILLTPGTSGAFLVAYSIALKHGGKLGFSDPSYPCYKNFAYLLDIKPVTFDIGSYNEYQLRVDDIKKKDINALQISSPANPTGNIYTKDNLKELVEYCNKQNINFISDELYHGLTYEDKAHSALEFGENVFVINGFSKYYCMPGLRLGWLIVPKNQIRNAEIIAQNLFISAPTLSQYAALEAFNEEHLKQTKDEFKRRRDYLYSELKDIFHIDAKPDGAFYLWADISNYSDNSYEFCKKILNDIHVAITPGVDFGKNQTNRYIRFAYTRDIKHMEEGVKRLKSYL
jgi:aspartate/methionine/tyrosine aminotransferase